MITNIDVRQIICGISVCSMTCQLHSFRQTDESFKWSMHRKLLRTAGTSCFIAAMQMDRRLYSYTCNVVVIMMCKCMQMALM